MYASIPDSEKSNHYDVIARIPSRTSDLWIEQHVHLTVLSTDYRSYTIAHTCEEVGDDVKETFWITSRTTSVSEAVFDIAKGLLKKYTYIELDQLESVLHDC
jgi:hypothetical protein